MIMADIERILVECLPGGRAQPSVERGAFLARRFDAVLHLYQEPGDSRSDARPGVERLAAPFQREGLPVFTRVGEGRAGMAGLLSETARVRPDLLVTATRFHPELGRFATGGLDRRLLVSSPVPTLFIRRPERTRGPVVLVAIDPVHPGDPAGTLDYMLMTAGGLFARGLHGQIHVFHSYRRNDTWPERLVRPLKRFLVGRRGYEAGRRNWQHHKEAVCDVFRRYGVRERHVHLTHESPADGLVRTAEEIGADLVVMGGIDRSRPARPRIGSLAGRVVNRLDTDLLVLKPPGFRTPDKGAGSAG